MILIIEFAESIVRYGAAAWVDDAGAVHIAIEEPHKFGPAVVQGERLEAAGHAAGKRVGFEVGE